MPKAAGRNYILTKGAAVVGGVRALSLKLDATPIDITDNDSDGIVELFATETASKQLSISVSGIFTDMTLRTLAMNSSASLFITDLTFTHAGGILANDIISGNFFMTNYEDSATYEGPGEFSATFVSSGPWTAA